MTNQELRPLGTKVKFDHDGLQAKGVIIVHEDNKYSVIVHLTEDNGAGWEINRYECPGQTQFYGKKGWHVPYAKLCLMKTKLGNEL